MKRSLVVVFLAVAVAFVLLPARAQADSEQKISRGRYITGGVLGTVIGIGVGHAVQGRYMPLGLVFTLGEIAAFTVAIADSKPSLTTTGTRSLGTAGTIGLIAYLGLHVWEVIDVWVCGAKNADFSSGKKAELPPPGPRLAAIPTVLNEAPAMAFMMRF